ncbi:hypothetical protein PM082_011902 [Marasmius tenuissimus]|nr:hypothetical protein PM082_011902 [Marasmius tenuissimus]
MSAANRDTNANKLAALGIFLKAGHYHNDGCVDRHNKGFWAIKDHASDRTSLVPSEVFRWVLTTGTELEALALKDALRVNKMQDRNYASRQAQKAAAKADDTDLARLFGTS